MTAILIALLIAVSGLIAMAGEPNPLHDSKSHLGGIIAPLLMPFFFAPLMGSATPREPSKEKKEVKEVKGKHEEKPHSDHKEGEDEHHEDKANGESEHKHGEEEHGKDAQHAHSAAEKGAHADHGEEAEENDSVGPDKGIVEASEQDGFKLSPEAFKNFDLKFTNVSGQGPWTIPASSLVLAGEEVNLFRLRNGFFKRIDFQITKKSDISMVVSSKDLKAGDQIVVVGQGFLRIAELAAFGGMAEGHSH